MSPKTTFILLLIASVLILESSSAPASDTKLHRRTFFRSFFDNLSKVKRKCDTGQPCNVALNNCFCEGEDLVCEYVNIQGNSAGYKCVPSGDEAPI